MSDASPALELRALTKRYDDGFLALDGVDLVVPDGEFFGLLGPNGAGKTTMISAVCNLIRTTSGEARIFGHPASSMEARRLIGLAERVAACRAAGIDPAVRPETLSAEAFAGLIRAIGG